MLADTETRERPLCWDHWEYRNRMIAEGAAAERAAVVAWLLTLPWRGSGSLTPGEMVTAIEAGAHTKETR